MPTEQEFLACFKMPAGFSITRRTTTIRNVFVAAIVPLIQPTAAEIAQLLDILGMEPADLHCSYCGDKANQWDHFRPLVTDGKPSGYPSSIRNLVPSCGQCNQSKGKSDWKTWMTGGARWSPATRNIGDLEVRVQRLHDYERWANCRPLDIESLVDGELWNRYYALQADILDKMREAQQLALELSRQVQQSVTDSSERE